jgi:hypothetical protein
MWGRCGKKTHHRGDRILRDRIQELRDIMTKTRERGDNDSLKLNA